MEPIENMTNNDVKVAARALKKGKLVAFPTETVYGLGADATNSEAVARVYAVKNRPLHHPVIVHVSSFKQATLWVNEMPEYARKLALEFWPGPMTLILFRSNLAQGFITGNQATIAIRIPSHPIAVDLLMEFESLGGAGVAAPSANKFGAVSPTSYSDVYEEIGDVLSNEDLILDGGKCDVGIESTIIDCSSKVPRILRPGAITYEEISHVTELKLPRIFRSSQVKAPGTLDSHYAPKARVKLDIKAKPGDGFIAMAGIPTPEGAIRLSAPLTSKEYARTLYSALRLGDQKKLKTIVAIQPKGTGIEVGIRERLRKSANYTNKLT